MHKVARIRSEKNRKTKNIYSSSSQCHQIIRYQRLAAAEEEGNTARETKENFIIICPTVLENGDTKTLLYLHISTLLQINRGLIRSSPKHGCGPDRLNKE